MFSLQGGFMRCPTFRQVAWWDSVLRKPWKPSEACNHCLVLKQVSPKWMRSLWGNTPPLTTSGGLVDGNGITFGELCVVLLFRHRTKALASLFFHQNELQILRMYVTLAFLLSNTILTWLQTFWQEIFATLINYSVLLVFVSLPVML